MKYLPAVLALLAAAPAHASVGAMLTDDAVVTGRGKLRLDTWVQADRLQFGHWGVATVGATGALDLSIGAVWGAAYVRGARIGATGPVLQAKLELLEPRENRWAGVALVAGAAAPYDAAQFGPEGWRGFVYLVTTQQGLGSTRLNVHANLGFTATHLARETDVRAMGGVALTVAAWNGLSGIAEVFYRDSFGIREGGAVQGGLRWQIGESITLDGFVGGGAWGVERATLWGALGLRLDSPSLW